MKKNIIISLVIGMGVFGFLGSVFRKNEVMQVKAEKEISKNKEQELTFEGEYVFLQKILNCDEDHAVAIADTFEKVTGQKLEDAELISKEKRTRILRVTSDKNDYYLQISGVNVVNEIRADAKDGEILYQIIY